jgi:hypothetical protein
MILQFEVSTYKWECLPGHWSQYPLVLAMASSASGHTYYGRNALKRKQGKRHKLVQVEMIRPDRALISAPILDGIQHKLPLRVDKLFGSINLPWQTMHYALWLMYGSTGPVDNYSKLEKW